MRSLKHFVTAMGIPMLVALFAPPASAAQVVYTTAKDAYVNAGRENGLAVGQKLNVFRRKKAIGSCEVVQVSSEQVLCRGERLVVGDTVVVPRAPPKPPRAPPPKPRPVLPSEAEQQKRRAIADALPVEKVAWKGGPARGWVSGRTTLRAQAWAVSTTQDGVFVRPSIDAQMRAGLGWGFAAASLRVVGDVLAPANQRFRPGELVELYVWGASIGVDDGPVVGEIGRFYGRKLAGTVLLDGIQVGTRLFDGAFEVGVYGGAIPALYTTAPGFDRLTAGLYAGVDVPVGGDIYVLQRTRIAALSTGDVATIRGDLEALAQVVHPRWGNVSASARGGLGGDLAPSLDGARVDMSLTALPSTVITGGYRYTAAQVFDFDLVPPPPLPAPVPVNGAHHATLGAGYELIGGVTLGALTGGGFDAVTGAFRAFAGPELAWSSPFGAGSSFDVGYLEELGEHPGRSGWVGTGFTLGPARWVNRLSYFETESLADALREAALMSRIDVPLLSWLVLQGRIHGQQGLPSLLGDKRSAPGMLMLDVALSGAL